MSINLNTDELLRSLTDMGHQVHAQSSEVMEKLKENGLQQVGHRAAGAVLDQERASLDEDRVKLIGFLGGVIPTGEGASTQTATAAAGTNPTPQAAATPTESAASAADSTPVTEPAAAPAAAATPVAAPTPAPAPVATATAVAVAGPAGHGNNQNNQNQLHGWVLVLAIFGALAGAGIGAILWGAPVQQWFWSHGPNWTVAAAIITVIYWIAWPALGFFLGFILGVPIVRGITNWLNRPAPVAVTAQPVPVPAQPVTTTAPVAVVVDDTTPPAQPAATGA